MGDSHLFLVVALNTLENEQEHLVYHIHNLMVVVFKSHLEIETGELGQVPVGVGIFSSKDGPDLVHPLHISSDSHLFSQLRRLGQESGAAEVVDFEHSGTRLSCSGLEFGRLNLSEALRIEEGSEEISDAGAKTKDRMGDRGTEVDNPVGETSGLADTGVERARPSKLGK